MSLSSVIIPPPASGIGWEAFRQSSLTDSRAALPAPYRFVTRAAGEESLRRMYERRLGVEPKTSTNESLDNLARKYLQHLVGERGRIIHGYLNGCRADGSSGTYPIRVAGLIPEGAQAVVAHAIGISHASIETNPLRAQRFMDLRHRCAYISFDPAGQGYSELTFNPRNPDHFNPELFARHTLQFFGAVKAMCTEDPQLRELPIVGVGSSLGAASIIGAYRLNGRPLPIDGLLFDGPFLELGKSWLTIFKIVEPITRTLRKRETSADLLSVFVRKGLPSVRPGSIKAAYEANVEAMRAFGHFAIPFPFIHGTDLLGANKGFLEVGGAQLFPDKVAFVQDPHDKEVDPTASFALAERLGISRDEIFPTSSHSSFAVENPGLNEFLDKFTARVLG